MNFGFNGRTGSDVSSNRNYAVYSNGLVFISDEPISDNQVAFIENQVEHQAAIQASLEDFYEKKYGNPIEQRIEAQIKELVPKALEDALDGFNHLK